MYTPSISAKLRAKAFLAFLVLLAATFAAAVDFRSFSVKPSKVVQGIPSVGTVTLDGPAPPGGAVVTLTSLNSAVASVPDTITIPQGATSAQFLVSTLAVTIPTTVTIQGFYNGTSISPTLTVKPRSSVRGISGDLWADVIIGQPGFGNFTPNEVTATRVFNPGGVTVDTSVRPNRTYIYDGGNSRVLGLSHLGTCAAGMRGGQPCTTNSDCPGSICQLQQPATADLVLGQSAFNRTGCNGDSNYQKFPTRAAASATTLCGMAESQISILEGGSFANLALDGVGNLYVPDWDNHRVLRYNSPFTTDTIADYVWGQADFAANDCNRGRGVGFPDAQSLCFRSPFNEGFTGGVGIDSSGNLWVADNQNNRVLRFPKDPGTGIPMKTADLVLGQPDFTSSDHGSQLNQMWAPAAVRVDSAGKVYVVDAQPGGGGDSGGRVLIFNPPLFSGMSASSTLGAGQFRNPSSLEFDPGGGIWVSDSANNQLLLFVGGAVQKVLYKDVPDYTGMCGGNYQGDGPDFVYGDGSVLDPSNVCGSFGSIGIDSDGNVIEAASSSWQDVWRFPVPFPDPMPGTAHSADVDVFKPYQFSFMNQVGPAGINSSNGIAVSNGQLVVADHGRILFWNNTSTLTTGQPANGYTGVGVHNFQYENQVGYGRMAADKASHLWVVNSSGDTGQIDIYSLPLTTEAMPFNTLASPLPVLGGGTVSWDSSLIIGGVAPVGTGSKLWVADPVRNRVFRVSNPLANPVVDIVLGQTSLDGTLCNQGNGDEGNLMPSQNSLCKPGSVSLDPVGNVYVSDDSLEVSGNQRLLEFDASLFPDNPPTALFGIPATRVFGRSGSFTDPNCELLLPFIAGAICGPLQPAFTSDGQMVVGMIGYLGSRFPMVYATPLASDQPDSYLNDFSSYGGYSAVFDSNDDLYINDLDRARVLVYRHPLVTGGVPVVGLSPASLNFGPQGLTVPNTPQTVTLTNSGTASLLITNISITGPSSGDYTQTNTCPASLSAGDQCAITIVFSPLGNGTRTAAITIVDNGTGSPQSVPMTGIGVGGKVRPK